MLRSMDESLRMRRPAAATRDAADTEGRDVRSTNDVIQNHLERFAERDLDGILSDYASGAVLFTPEGPLRDVESIRGLFQAMLVEFGKPGARFTLEQLSVEGDHGFIVWSAETADNVYELGTDTFFVHGGKIRVQSFAGKITPKR